MESPGICYAECDCGTVGAFPGAPLSINGEDEEFEESVIIIWQILNPA